MVIVEKSFPRGGVPVSKDKSSTPANTQIFGAVQKKIKKPRTKSSKKHLGELDDQSKGLETFSALPLSYETIQDGMVIMGIVKGVDQLHLNVALPGRISARVSALEISESYTKAVQTYLQNTNQSEGYKSLKELYSQGQIIYGRVQEVKNNKNGHVLIDMTLKPAEVHAELSQTSIRKGFVFNGAVEEVQEHGYIIESGIKGLRCFLPLDKSQPGHAVGEIIFLKVEKVTSDKSASTCICKQVPADNLKVKDQSDPNLDYLLPSTIVKFQVSKHLKDGLKGSIMNETFSAYVNEHQLSDTFTTIENFEINGQYEGRILYVMPLTKLVYVSLNLHNGANIKMENSVGDCEGEPDRLKHGDVVLDAKVHRLGTGGVILCLNNNFKGLLTYKTIKAMYRGNYDQDELLTKYAKGSTHKVRILAYDVMDSLYICDDATSTVNEKFFALQDLHPGERVTATVKAHYPKVGGYKLQVGKVKAIIEKMYLSSAAKVLDRNTKIKCRVVAVSHDHKIAYLTNRAEYMSTNCNILDSPEAAKINSNYTGTVVKSSKKFALVKFFADTKGVLYYQGSVGSLDHLEEGQTMPFRVVNKKDDKLILGFVENTFKMGEICPISIVNKLDSGLEIKVSYGAEEGEKDMEFKGLIPSHLLSDYVDLLRAKLQILQSGEQTQAVCVSGSIFSLRDVNYFMSHATLTWKTVKVGDILKAYIKDVNDEVVDIMLPINGYPKTVKVHLNMMLMDAKSSANIMVSKDQVVYVKILSKVEITKTLSVSAKLTDVWDCQLATTADSVEEYLNEVKSIKKALKKQGNPIGRCIVGEKVNAVFQCVNSTTKDWEYTLEKSNVIGIVKSWVVGKAPPPKEGTKQECVIVWADYSNNLVIISNKPGDIEHISAERKIPENLVGKSNVNAKVLFKNESVVVCSLKKGQHPLVYCPVQLHFNDFEKTASLKLCEGQFCKLSFIHNTLPIAVLDDTNKMWTEFNRKRKLQIQHDVKAKKIKMDNLPQKAMKPNQCSDSELSVVRKENKLKRKRNVSESMPEQIKQSKQTHEEAPPKALESATALFYEDKTADRKAASKVIKIEAATKTSETATKSLTGISDFWTTDLSNINKKDDSSEEEEDSEDENADSKAKKKLSAAEKFKQQKEEENRLRAIEEKYADPKQLPDSVDQFDRLVLSDPNNSKHWINYMVFHLQSTEIDKARAVARRALKTITFRNLDDQVNIWVALLNLELRYGNKENFNDTLKEAIMYNEPLKIYLRAVEIITDAQKNQELIEMIAVITKKFKAEQEMWKVAANALFTIGMTERAQQMLHKALACLPERDHVNSIVMFANLNHRHNHNEMAQTLLDQVVTSYPKRVDVWCQYVDMLCKEDLIDSARNVLERAVVQLIPLRKMRTIFKKYLEFEERYGTDANVQRVKQLAIDYVQKSENL